MKNFPLIKAFCVVTLITLVIACQKKSSTPTSENFKSSSEGSNIGHDFSSERVKNILSELTSHPNFSQYQKIHLLICDLSVEEVLEVLESQSLKKLKNSNRNVNLLRVSCMKRLISLSPERAQAFATNRLNSQSEGPLLYHYYRELAISDLQATIELVEEMKPSVDKKIAYSAIIQSISQSEAKELIEKNKLHLYHHDLLFSLIPSEPVTALELSQQLPDNSAMAVESFIIDQWSTLDPKAVMEYCSSQENSEKNVRFLFSAISQLISHDPSSAIESFLQNQSSFSDQQHVVFFSLLTYRNKNLAISSAKKLSDTDHEQLVNEAVFMSAKNQSFDQLVALLQELPCPITEENCTRIASRLALDYDGSLNYFRKIDNEEIRKTGIQYLIDRFIQNRPELCDQLLSTYREFLDPQQVERYRQRANSGSPAQMLAQLKGYDAETYFDYSNLLGEWVEHDPEGALVHYKSITDDKLKNALHDSFYHSLSTTNPSAYLLFFNSESVIVQKKLLSGDSYSQAIMTLASKDMDAVTDYINSLENNPKLSTSATVATTTYLAQLDTDLALNFISTLKNKEDKNTSIERMVTKMNSLSEPGKIAAYILESDLELTEFTGKKFLFAFSEVDLEGAIKFVDQLKTSKFKRDTRRGLVEYLSVSDPTKALAYIQSQKEDKWTSLMYDELGSNMVEHDLNEAQEMAATIPNRKHRESYDFAFIQGWMKKDVVAASVAIEQSEFNKKQSDIYSEMAKLYYKKEGIDAGVKWLNSIKNANNKKVATRAFFDLWVNFRPNDAAKYVNSLPSGILGDAAAEKLSDKFSLLEPSYALEWADSIDNASRKSLYKQRILHKWVENDPQAVKRWIKENNFKPSAILKESLMER